MAPIPTNLLLRSIRKFLVAEEDRRCPDRQLLQRFARDGDGGAFAALVQQYGPMVLGVCRRVLRHEQDAEDAFQAAFLVLARRADAVRESVGSYLYRVAYHLALKARAARARRCDRERRAVSRPCPEVLDEMTGRELRAVLDAELVRLPEKYRAPLLLCCLEGLARDEAARQLGWEPAMVKSRLERGRELLRQRLARRGLDLPAALGASVLVPSATQAVPGALAARVLDAAAGYASCLHSGAASAGAVALADTFLRSAVALRPRLAALLLTLGLAVAAVGPLGSGGPLAKPSGHKPPPARAGEAPAAKPDKAGEKVAVIEERDPLPAGAVTRFGSVRLRHGDCVNAVAFSPDGKTLASCSGGGRDSSVCFWDPGTGKLLRRLACGNSGVSALVFAPDGKTFATSCGEAFSLWITAPGKEVLQLPAPGGGRHSSLAFSPGGKLLATARDWRVVLWDLPTGKERRRIEGLGREVCVTFADRGRTLVTGDDSGHLRFWDVATGKLRFARKLPNKILRDDHEVYAVVASPDGKVVATGHNYNTRLWDAATGKELRCLPEPREGLIAYPIYGLAFTPDGKVLIASGSRGTLQRWEVATGRDLGRSSTGYDNGYQLVAVSPDGKTLATGGNYNMVHLWDARTLTERVRLPGHRQGIRAAALSPDGKTLATAGCDNTARLWDTVSGHETRRFKVVVPYSGTTPVAFAPDGQALAVGSGGKITVWGLDGVPLDHFIFPGIRFLRCLTYSPDGSLLAVGAADGPIHLLRPATGEEVGTLIGHSKHDLSGLAFSPDGRALVSCAQDRTVRCWDVTARKERWRFTAKQGPNSTVAYASDGKLVAVGTWSGSCLLLNAATGREVRAIQGTLDSRLHLTSVCFAPDGKTLATGSEDAELRLWDVETGAELRSFPGHMEEISSVVFSPDGKTLYSASNDGTALRWDLLAGADADRRKQRWADLEAKDPKVAYRALLSLAADPKGAIALIEKQVQPARAGDAAPPRAARTVRVLELIGSATARMQLERLARGAPTAGLTREARAALVRLNALDRPPAGTAPRRGKSVRRGKGPHFLQEYDGEITALAFTPDGKMMASCGTDGRVAVCTLATGTTTFDVTAHQDGALAVAFSPDGKLLVSGGADRVIRLWDPVRRRQVGTLEGHRGKVAALAFSPDGKVLASGDYDRTVCLWDLPRRTLRRRFTCGKGRVTALSFTPDGKTLAVGGVTCKDFGGGNVIPVSHADLVRRYDVATGKELTASKLRGSVVAYAPDGRSLLAAGLLPDISITPGGGRGINCKDLIILERRGNAALRLPRRGHTAALSPDGQLLVTGTGADWPLQDLEGGNVLGPHGTDATMSVWEAATGGELLRFPGVEAMVLAFAPDGRTLGVGTDAGLVLAWDVVRAGQSPEGADEAALWDQLADRDAARAYRAGCTLALAGPKGVALLRERLRPVPTVDEGRARQLVAQLDDRNFEVRTTASRKLAELGPAVELAVRAALAGRPSAEARRRLEGILEEIEKMPRTPEGLRRRRAIRVLEQAGTPEARRLLEDLSRGAPGALLTTEAKAALKRLSSRISGR